MGCYSNWVAIVIMKEQQELFMGAPDVLMLER